MQKIKQEQKFKQVGGEERKEGENNNLIVEKVGKGRERESERKR